MFNSAEKELYKSQEELLQLYRQNSQTKDEIINHLKRLVDFQENQIDYKNNQLEEVQNDLHVLKIRLESYAQQVEHYKDKLFEIEKQP